MPKKSIKKRADGRYAVQVYVGQENGKRKYITVYGKSPSEVNAQADELRIKRGKGIDITSISDTYSDWLARWSSSAEISMTDSEHSMAKFRAEFLEAYVGSVPLQSIDTYHIQNAINALAKKNPSTGKPTAKRTLTRYLNAFSAVFDCAIQNRAVDYNPCQYVKIPKESIVLERHAISAEQQQWINDTPHRAQTAAMLLLYSGLRRGEATALLWSDIDFNKKTITVNKSYDFKEDKIKYPKTKAGRRTVTVPQKLLDYLLTVNKSGLYVLQKTDGGMMTNSSWRRLWESYIQELDAKYSPVRQLPDCGIPKETITIDEFTPHCLRHTFCSIMHAAGVDVLTAQYQMGHADVKTTLAIYTHLDKEQRINEVSKLDEYLKNKTIEESDSKQDASYT